MLWGDGSPTREFLYVDDCVDGLVAAAERYDEPEPVNLGTGVETSIRETAELVAEAVGFTGAITWDTAMPNGQPRRSLDTSPCPRALRLDGEDAAPRRHRADGRLVPRRRRVIAPGAAPAAPSRFRQSCAALGRAADAVARHVVLALAVILLVQVGVTVALFFSVNHNGWLTYQGGDQIWLVTSGWLLGKGAVGYALTSHGWPMLLAPLTWITGSSSVQLLPLTTILQVGVLAPIATLAVYDIGARLAGRLAGLWCACAFVAAPFLAIPYFVQRYHDSWVDQFLPQALGLTQQADFPSVVAVLVSAAFTVRALKAAAYREALLAGTFAGVALALKPANALYLGGPALAFLLARRWSHAAIFAAALGPALLALAIWKAKGLGQVPLFAQEELRLALGATEPALGSVTSWFDRTVNLDFDVWKQNMSNLREFTWSARVLQWLPLAGALAVARRSLPAAGLLLGWLLGYVVVKGAAEVATVESGSYWRLIMPALPAFVLLSAAVPLLVPTAMRRLGPRLEAPPTRAPRLVDDDRGRRVSGLVPLVWLVASSPSVSRPARPTATSWPTDRRRQDRSAGRPGRHRPDRHAHTGAATSSAGRTRPGAHGPSTASTARRPRTASPTTICEVEGGRRCELRAETLVTTRGQPTSTRRRRPTRSTVSASLRTGSTTRTRATCSRSARRSLRLHQLADRRRRRPLERVEPRAQQRHLLGQQHVVVGQPGEHRRVVQEHGDHEHDRRGEEDRRRVALDAEPARDRVEPAAPDREHEQDEPGHEPEQRVALLQPPAADQLEDDEEQRAPRRSLRRSRSGPESPMRSSDGHGVASRHRDEQRERHLERVVDRAEERDRRRAVLALAHRDRHLEEAQAVLDEQHRRLDLGVVARVVAGEERDGPAG